MGWKQFRRGIPIPQSENDFVDSGLKTLEVEDKQDRPGPQENQCFGIKYIPDHQSIYHNVKGPSDRIDFLQE